MGNRSRFGECTLVPEGVAEILRTPGAAINVDGFRGTSTREFYGARGSCARMRRKTMISPLPVCTLEKNDEGWESQSGRGERPR
jgi:hypothetical protein